MFLENILRQKSLQLERAKGVSPLSELIKIAEQKPAPADFHAALNNDGVSIVAEIKKASPSKGMICHDFEPATIADIYIRNGVSAISVLTEEKHFLGKLDYLEKVKTLSTGANIPVLRKDFIFDVYQVYESRAHGADCILLITAILKQDRLQELLDISHSLKMHCLVEIHDRDELKTALDTGAQIIGINNRDLNTFQVDLTTTERLRPLIPTECIVVSESGIKSREDMEKLKQWKVDAALVGEALMSANNVETKLRELKI